MPNTTQIVLPGLFDLPLDELPTGFVEKRLTWLNHILRFAAHRANQAYTLDAILSKALSLPENKPGGLPMANAFVENGGRDHMLVQPVHLRPDLSSALVVPIERNSRNLSDIGVLLKDLGNLFCEDFELNEISENLFLMRLESTGAPTHYPHVLSVLGKSAKPYIEQSRENLDWYRLLNEMQMYLHQHAINQQRFVEGLLPINSLWCWGGGPIPQQETATAWYCDDLVLHRFGDSLGLPAEKLRKISDRDHEQDAIIIDLRLLEATKSGVAVALDEMLLDIEQNILAMVVPMARGKVCLRAGFEFDFNLNPGDRYKFWRTRRNLADWQWSAQAF